MQCARIVSVQIPIDGRRSRPRPDVSPVVRGGGGGARASDRVYAELASAIRDLRLPPGLALSETELADQLQVSRTPLREAVARLVDNGLVQVVPQVGTRVALIRLSDVEEARFVRESLEVAAFEAACAIPDRDLTTLRELLDRQERACVADDLDDFFAADEAMHEQIFRLSGHPGAWQAVQRMKVQLDRLRRLSLPEPRALRELIAEHTLIVAALEAGDVTEGRARISAHARRVQGETPTLMRKHPDYFAD
jgi:DNA-binding GntR family transcriptional regulator